MTDEELSKLIAEFLPYPSKDQHYALRSFAKLVAEAEREACAKNEPIAWIKARELTYMKAVVEHGATEWKTNLGLKPEDGDVPLYTAPPQREWQGLSTAEVKTLWNATKKPSEFAKLLTAKLKEKNT